MFLKKLYRSEITPFLSFWVWIILLYSMYVRFLHAVACGDSSFSWLWSISMNILQIIFQIPSNATLIDPVMTWPQKSSPATFAISCCSHRSAPFIVGRTTQGCEYRESRLSGGHLKGHRTGPPGGCDEGTLPAPLPSWRGRLALPHSACVSLVQKGSSTISSTWWVAAPTLPQSYGASGPRGEQPQPQLNTMAMSSLPLSPC